MYLTDTIGSGGTLFDADGDGDLDLYLLTGRPLEKDRAPSGTNALFLNSGDGTFRRAGPEAGLDVSEFGMGTVSFDYDGDGDQDLYVTNRGPNRLYRNRGDATFEEVGAEAGVDDPRWSSGVTAGDYDRDGDLDVFVANYIDYELRDHRIVRFGRFEFAAGPNFYPGVPDSLYRNEGDGTFTSAEAEAGVEGPDGRGLGATFVDLDADGWVDLLVANDTTPNFLYQNLRDGTFENVALRAGVAADPAGKSESGMGIAIGDYDSDGWIDFLVTNFSTETNALHHNDGEMGFPRTTRDAGLAGPSFMALGFGTDLEDFDNDGDLDLLVVNGHISPRAERFPPSPQEYAQPAQLFLNDGEGRFSEVGTEAGSFFDRRQVGRGTLPGDLDDDGDLDLVITSVDGPAVVLSNVAPPGRARAGSFLTVRLEGRGGNRDAVGARVEVTAAGRTQVRVARAGTSYLCDTDPRLHFGLGDAERVEQVRVRWPSGRESLLEGLEPNQFLELAEPPDSDVPRSSHRLNPGG